MKLGAFIILVIFNCVKSDVFTFTRNGNLSFPNKLLQNHVFQKHKTKSQLTQCAMECFRTQQCKSFNFGSNVSVCELNDATHEEFPGDLFPDESGHSIQYHVREAFFIEPEAVGPCGTYPCKNQGRCLDTKSVNGHRMYICHCPEGWTGKDCEVKEQELEWAAWEDWGTCSVSCGYGYQTRRRQCIDVTNGSPHLATECYGRDVEYQACAYKECPRWDEWSGWSECSTYTTCGRGYKLRHRNCSNGGIAGVDRYCKGPSNESAVCDGISCKGMVRLVDGSSFGEGRVEMYNNVNQSWLQVCGDTWSLSMADIVCKQTGFLAAFKAITDGRYDTTSSDGAEIVTTNCASGGEITIHQCARSKTKCSSNAGVQCKVQGAWSLWATWGDCSVTCANGTRTRTRDCDHPPPNHGGTPCPGINTEYKACSLPLCPIDGVWTMWTDWSECSVSCANGTQYRTRQCIGPFYDGKNCTGPDEEVIECFPKTCPVDGIWNPWAEWTTCTVTCGYGTRTRDRTCHGPFYEGLDCVGDTNEIESCNSFSCPVDGAWLLWAEWGQCDVSCGGGIRNRTRDCSLPKHGGRTCSGASMETEMCNQHECAVDGVWLEWSLWTDCSVTCANGTRSRDRGCDGPLYGGKNCTGDWNEIEVCMSASCPVDGIWNSWSEWEECNVTCGGGGQSRYRDCHGPFFDGAPCEGNSSESRDCNMHFCPVDGIWYEWSNWTECTLTCGSGVQSRNRTCEGPYHGGQNCSGDGDEVRECNTQYCPVDGYWETWSNWTNCNVSCGGGNQWRTRMCEEPKHGGEDCHGDDMESVICNNHSCPIDGVWDEWIEWSSCSMSCGNGTRNRTRPCIGPYYAGEECVGEEREDEVCNTFHCPVDGIWDEWSEWGPCSVSCGRGKKSRSRTCIGPEYNGTPCVGQSEESSFCNPSFCPVDGIWLVWGTWSPCDVTCGSGSRYRDRTCDGPYDGGQDCWGSSREVAFCIPGKCPVDGVHGSWSEWSECPVTCGGAVVNRTRTCTGPFHGGRDCEEPMAEQTECASVPCPIDGDWSHWASWSTCNVTCGGGSRSRYRYCSAAEFGGKNCTGDSEDFTECNDHPCPVDGLFMPWSEWGDCSVSCGTGERWRNRTCDGPYHGGNNCTGSNDENGNCNTHECPVNGIFDKWSEWGTCTTTCGGGIRDRNRTCIGPFYGGANCSGPYTSEEECNEHDCPVDGVWNEWASWDDCNVTCGGGIQWRNRDCHGPFHGGANCTGLDMDNQECNTQNCPVDGVWLPWSSWNLCDVTCGGGIQNRSRDCDGPFYDGKNCTGDELDFRSCNEDDCPIDGEWKEWGSWELCSVSCGGGKQSRYRECYGPFYGGQNCTGDDQTTQDCNTQPCPFDGVFSEWSKWYECDVTCGGGIQLRNRSCFGPFFNGSECVGNFTDSKECNAHNCPVDGVWAPWAKWEECNTTCGGGIQWRFRECKEPLYGGADCSGEFDDYQICNENPCPVDGIWDEWMTWGSCSVSCAGGIQLRHRNCIGPFYDGNDCAGQSEEEKICNTHNCPVDGKFSDWSHWMSCDVTCGGGTQWRNRTCKGPFHGGAPCNGSYDDSQECNINPCPVDGVWKEWTAWADCTVTCGGGTSNRSRDCDGPYHNGKECEGNSTETVICGTDLCPIPGEWLEWSSWSLCSVTCGGGKRSRIHVCNDTSYGDLTAPCLGDEKEVVDCHTFSCDSYPRHCSELKNLGLVDSVHAEIDPLRLQQKKMVYCDMEAEDGVGVTIIGHDREKRERVLGYEGAGEYKLVMEYNISRQAVEAVVDSSEKCSQFLKWECKGAVIHNPRNNEIWTTYWVGRKGAGPLKRVDQYTPADYFPGAEPGSYKCACAMNTTCPENQTVCNTCANPTKVCNCDTNDSEWREDGGYVTERSDLPIIGFFAGDTGGVDEDSYRSIGVLQCYGLDSTLQNAQSAN